MDVILVFESTHNALSAEALLLQSSISLEIMPTPREISASCGISIRVRHSSLPQIIALMEKGTLKVHAIYEMDNLDRTLRKV